ncbi:MAG: hypothetical protein K2O59_03980 [Lachnospiraceae bacterium]|nr:hypothetical protein [Lachnospiraceae bacterium]
MVKKGMVLLLILASVCVVAIGVVICTKNTKSEIVTEYDEVTYTYEETELGNELNISSEDYSPTEE